MRPIPPLAAAGLAFTLSSLVAPASARADFVNKVLSVSSAIGYGVAVTGGLLTTAVNGVAIAFDEGSAPGWRLAGVVAGAADLALGAGLLINDSSDPTTQLYAAVPLVAGVAAVATTIFAPAGEGPGVALAPMLLSGDGAGVVWCGRF